MKEFFIVIALIGIALFLILLVLVQRGRGGGLAGALGGAGGQSAFGAKAGDTFTKITMWTAFFWIVFCVVAVRLMTGSGEPDFSSTLGGAAHTKPVQEGNLTEQSGAETESSDSNATNTAPQANSEDQSEKAGKALPATTGTGEE